MTYSAEASNSRRNFLRGRFSSVARAVRPPWALAEQDFLSTCTRCAECLPVCPSQILRKGDGAYPVVDFSVGECTFCGACLDACVPRALRKVEGGVPWTLAASLGETCLALRHVECRVCGEMCGSGAIRFVFQAGSVARPVLYPEKCNGCGACSAPCPAQALHIAPVE